MLKTVNELIAELQKFDGNMFVEPNVEMRHQAGHCEPVWDDENERDRFQAQEVHLNELNEELENKVEALEKNVREARGIMVKRMEELEAAMNNLRGSMAWLNKVADETLPKPEAQTPIEASDFAKP